MLTMDETFHYARSHRVLWSLEITEAGKTSSASYSKVQKGLKDL